LVGAFSQELQEYWIRRCLTEYPQGVRSNILTHFDIPEETNIWELGKSTKPEFVRFDTKEYHNEAGGGKKQILYSGQDILRKLRWINIGCHFSFFERKYLEGKTPFPEELTQYGKDVGLLFGFSNFKAQSAFVNYYHYGDTITGHTDSSELDMNFPIISARFFAPFEKREQREEGREKEKQAQTCKSQHQHQTKHKKFRPFCCIPDG